MTVDRWLQGAVADAERRGLTDLTPLLEGFAQSLRQLRAAGFGLRADGQRVPARRDGARPVAVPLESVHHLAGVPGAPLAAAAVQPPVHQSIDALGRRLRSGSVTAVQLVEECLARIEATDRLLNAFILVSAEAARRQAAIADDELATGHDRGPLHGIPISLKDLVDVEGQPTTAASRVREGHIAAQDALVVTHLRRAGAVFVGKTNLHEFAFGTTNEDSAFGPARHPLDETRSPGGSSGGSAISVATGMAIASVGTDTGGSIRIPAAACGLVGFKPAVGDISTDGVVPLSWTLDHVGPLASSVTDAWHVYRALSGQVDVAPLRATEMTRVRLALPRRYFCEVLEPGVRASFETAIERLRTQGAAIDEVAVTQADRTAAVYLPIVLSEAAAFHAATLEASPERYTTPVRLRFEMARYVLAEDYLLARRGREVLRVAVDEALDGYDALVLPTLPLVAPPIGEVARAIDGVSYPVRNLMLRLTQLFDITGHPALTLPCGFAGGLPVGLQLVGRQRGASDLFHAALAVERALAGA